MPLDFTGNDPNKFQDVRQYADPNDPRYALDAASANVLADRAVAPIAIPEAPVRPLTGFTNPADAVAYKNQMAAHNQAVQDAKNYAELAKYHTDALHAAQQHVDAGDFLHAASELSADDPELADKLSSLLIKSPLAGGHPGVQDTLSTLLNANYKHTALREQQTAKGEAYDEKAQKALAEAVKAGTITQDDTAWNPNDPKSPMPKIYGRNPYTGKLTVNLDYVSKLDAARQAAGFGTKAVAQDVSDRKDAAAAINFLQKRLDSGEVAEGSPEYQSLQDQIGQHWKTIQAPVRTRVGSKTTAPGAQPVPAAPKPKTPISKLTSF